MMQGTIGKWGLIALILGLSAAVAAPAAEPAAASTTTTTQTAAKRPPMSKAISQSLAIGEQAPDFTVLTPGGDEISLKANRGKVVLVAFYAGWCGFCVRDLPALKALHEEFGKNKNFVMIGMSLDETMEKTEAYAEKNKIAWPEGFLGDWAKDLVSRKYKVKEIPAMFLIDPAGKIIDKEDHAKWLRESIAKALKKK